MNHPDPAGTGRDATPTPIAAAQSSGRPFDASDDLGEPVSHLSGDRVCTHCHHDLAGQPVYRERRYGLVIARCPECGRFTPMLEYPTLGRWGKRLGAVFAALVLLAVGVFMLASAGVVAAIGYAVGQIAVEKVNLEVSSALQAFSGDQNWWSNPEIYQQWLSATGGIPAIIQSHGGVIGALSPGTIYPTLALALAALAIGILIAVFVPGQRGVRLVLVALTPPLIGMLYLVPWLVSITSRGSGQRYTAFFSADAELLIALPVTAGAWFFVLVPGVALGALIGRRVARVVVRMLLPPRHRLALSYLWTSDGLPPPVQRAHSVACAR